MNKGNCFWHLNLNLGAISFRTGRIPNNGARGKVPVLTVRILSLVAKRQIFELNFEHPLGKAAAGFQFKSGKAFVRF